jgi:hypothetical protein
VALSEGAAGAILRVREKEPTLGIVRQFATGSDRPRTEHP